MQMKRGRDEFEEEIIFIKSVKPKLSDGHKPAIRYARTILENYLQEKKSYKTPLNTTYIKIEDDTPSPQQSNNLCNKLTKFTLYQQKQQTQRKLLDEFCNTYENQLLEKSKALKQQCQLALDKLIESKEQLQNQNNIQQRMNSLLLQKQQNLEQFRNYAQLEQEYILKIQEIKTKIQIFKEQVNSTKLNAFNDIKAAISAREDIKTKKPSKISRINKLKEAQSMLTKGLEQVESVYLARTQIIKVQNTEFFQKLKNLLILNEQLFKIRGGQKCYCLVVPVEQSEDKTYAEYLSIDLFYKMLVLRPSDKLIYGAHQVKASKQEETKQQCIQQIDKPKITNRFTTNILNTSMAVLSDMNISQALAFQNYAKSSNNNVGLSTSYFMLNSKQLEQAYFVDDILSTKTDFMAFYDYDVKTKFYGEVECFLKSLLYNHISNILQNMQCDSEDYNTIYGFNQKQKNYNIKVFKPEEQQQYVLPTQSQSLVINHKTQQKFWIESVINDSKSKLSQYAIFMLCLGDRNRGMLKLLITNFYEDMIKFDNKLIQIANIKFRVDYLEYDVYDYSRHCLNFDSFSQFVKYFEEKLEKIIYQEQFVITIFLEQMYSNSIHSGNYGLRKLHLIVLNDQKIHNVDLFSKHFKAIINQEKVFLNKDNLVDKLEYFIKGVDRYVTSIEIPDMLEVTNNAGVQFLRIKNIFEIISNLYEDQGQS